MTLEERIEKLVLLRDGRGGDPGYPKTFGEAHELVTEVMGRDVWTHEIAYIDSLIAELRRGTPADFEEIVEKIPAEKRVIVVLDDSQ